MADLPSNQLQLRFTIRRTYPMKNPFNKQTFDARKVDREVLSPQEFLVLKDKSPSDIKSSRPVGPTLGKPGFGGIEVTYSSAKFRVA